LVKNDAYSDTASSGNEDGVKHEDEGSSDDEDEDS
jgi:hypothetical protein